MMPDTDNLAVIIGASPRVERLRRRLRQGGVRNLGVATSLPGLRRELHAGEHEFVVSCLLLDEDTLDRHAGALRGLIADTATFAADFRCVGLVPDVGLMPEAACLGCHLYVRRPDDVLGAIAALTQWHPPRAVVPAGRWTTAQIARAPFGPTRAMTGRRPPPRGFPSDRFDAW